ncbi:chitinase [Brevifollis gellanilyticus]|uniref:chitinase n=2 Tax=Brevifollis gellanilyticus TaxID=748831 RepID=A0A512MAN0_9BACT|nr:chitinase [Brevifollis gellanilyticus]
MLMPNQRCVIAICALLLSAVLAQAQSKVVAYVPNWIDLGAFAKTIDYSRLTHVNVAFENPVNGEGELSFNPDNKVLIEKARAAGVKVLVSIGGGSASSEKKMRQRYFDLLKKARRSKFAAQFADYVVSHGFDGLDVDLEGPAINEDYGAFIDELATLLKPKGKLLTAALSQGYGGDNVPASVFAHFDFVNIMAYDATGPWDKEGSGQHSSLDFARSNVAWWLKRGLPKSKAVLGVPFYGYGFGKAYKSDEYSYADIIAAHPGAEKKDQVGETIWYNSIPTIKAKTQLVLDQDLAGIMIWSLNSDAPGDHSLLKAIDETLSPKSRQ